MPAKTHPAINPTFRRPARDPALQVLLAMMIWVAWACINPVGLVAATTKSAPTGTKSDRYLLIVDTSTTMERNAENTQRIVGQLMATGMIGQAHAGDTFGLWTFNEELRTGDFPLQLWTPQTRQRVASAAFEFLKKQQYQKDSRFEKVLEPLTSVVKDSDRITVIILTDGSVKISGTPFDQEINESYRLNYDAQRKQRMPFITVLRAKAGEFIGWRVNTPPFRPEFPAFPIEPEVVEPPEAVVESKPESKPEPQPPPTPSLIVVGEPPPEVSSTPTNVPTAATTQPPDTDPARLMQDPSPPPRPDVHPAQPVETTATPIPPGGDAPALVKPVEPKPESQPAAPATPVTPTPTEVTSKPPPTQSPSPKNDLPSAEPRTGEPATVAMPTTPATEPATEATTVQTAIATPGESLFNRTNLLIVGVVLLVVACGLSYVLMRRTARPAEKVSLITSSMDRDKDNP